MTTSEPDRNDAIIDLAAAHGLQIDPQNIRVVEAGLDYRVAFVVTDDGSEWVLRIPRREDVVEKIEEEACILEFARGRISPAVPDWRIRSSDLIAYPLLPGKPGLTVTAAGEPEWHFDRENPRYARELGLLIAELHSIEPRDAGIAGVPPESAADVRLSWHTRLEQVSAEFEIKPELNAAWRSWIDDDELWPESTVFTHGELYPAHLLLGEEGGIRSVLDWTTAKVSDPVVDFMYHHALSSKETFEATVATYTAETGRELPRLAERCAALVAAGPLTYADYALTTGEPEHAAAAVAQLNP